MQDDFSPPPDAGQVEAREPVSVSMLATPEPASRALAALGLLVAGGLALRGRPA